MQKAIGINSYPFPQKNGIREYLKILQRRAIQRKKEQFTNKGRDTLLNDYTKDKFQSVYCKLQARGAALLLEYYFYTLINILLGYYILTHSGNKYSTKILNLFTFKFKGKGPTRYIPLIFTIYVGKQNQYGRYKTIGALQDRKPLIYILSRLAFYLLNRQNFSTKLYLDLSRRLVQYNIRLIKSGRDRKVALLYNLQRDQVVKAFQYISVFLEKKIYIRRSVSAKTVELKGVSKDQIWRARR